MNQEHAFGQMLCQQFTKATNPPDESQCLVWDQVDAFHRAPLYKVLGENLAQLGTEQEQGRKAVVSLLAKPCPPASATGILDLAATKHKATDSNSMRHTGWPTTHSRDSSRVQPDLVCGQGARSTVMHVQRLALPLIRAHACEVGQQASSLQLFSSEQLPDELRCPPASNLHSWPGRQDCNQHNPDADRRSAAPPLRRSHFSGTRSRPKMSWL
jgi:hypothetical protein